MVEFLFSFYLHINIVRRTDEIRFGTFTKETVDRHYGMIPFSDAYGKFEADNDGHTILFAIPSSAMQTNTNIVQNPGY